MTLQWQTLGFTELTREELYAVLRLRQEVFVVEQRCAYLDLDNLDQQATHMLCMQKRELLAYQRCLAPGLSYPESSLGRIVVCPAMRGKQLGRELVRRGIEHNLLQWPDRDICISAQAHLQDFYATVGFAAEGSEYFEDDILHRRMRYRAPKTRSGIT
jgi:ElaA protein